MPLTIINDQTIVICSNENKKVLKTDAVKWHFFTGKLTKKELKINMNEIFFEH